MPGFAALLHHEDLTRGAGGLTKSFDYAAHVIPCFAVGWYGAKLFDTIWSGIVRRERQRKIAVISQQ